MKKNLKPEQKIDDLMAVIRNTHSRMNAAGRSALRLCLSGAIAVLLEGGALELGAFVAPYEAAYRRRVAARN